MEFGLQVPTVSAMWKLSGTQQTELLEKLRDYASDVFTWGPIFGLKLPLPILI